MCSTPPPTIPFKFRRKSSSASTTVSMDNQYGPTDAGSSSPLQSSPVRTPLHLTRRDEHTGSQAGDYFDDLDGVLYDQQDEIEDAAYPWSCDRPLFYPLPYMRRPLPSLMTKFAADTLRGDSLLAYNPSPFYPTSQTAYLYPQGDSAIADECEEYDLESMDIHIRETYFTTSAERGRWLSSPIAARVRLQTIPPMRGRSSPVKPLAVISPSPSRGRLYRQTRSCSVDKLTSTPLPEDHDEDMRCSSTLPPSSPLSSPISTLSFLGDDCENDSIVDPRSKSNDRHSESGITITYAPPVEHTCTPSPREVPAVALAFHPTDGHCHPPSSIVSGHTSPSTSHSPQPIDVHVHVPGTTGFELGGILSPLSRFETDVSETEPLKLPLSDTVNKPLPEIHAAGVGVTPDTARSRDGSSSIQSTSLNMYAEPRDVFLTPVGGPSCNMSKKSEPASGKTGARQTKKRTVIRSGSTSSSVRAKGAESHMTAHSKPPNKKFKSSHRRDDLRSCGTISLQKFDGTTEVKRLSRSPSRTALERHDSESAYARNGETQRPRGHSESRVQNPSATATPMGVVDIELHVSLTGMLIEALATSRATSMDALALYAVVIQAHPHLAAERPKKELLKDIATVLEAGRARCGMFEKVDSSREGSRDKTLENRWFYVPERDEDLERAALISAIMPRQKRRETKKYKQYYYQPLDRICRWDPEDAP